MGEPFTIEIFVPDGDPDGVRIINDRSRPGIAFVFPREEWVSLSAEVRLQRMGVYVLVGYRDEDPELPSIYIGQARDVHSRITDHMAGKDFWETGIAFVSVGNDLHRGHTEWLEYELIRLAKDACQCHLENSTNPKEPPLDQPAIALMKLYLKQLRQIFPLVQLHAFEKQKVIIVEPPQSLNAKPTLPVAKSTHIDTVVVTAHQENFDRQFINEQSWHQIRIHASKLNIIKYIACYRTSPKSAITHYAPVERIEPYGEHGKYKLYFASEAVAIGPISRGANKSVIQGTKYTNLEKLKSAKDMQDL